MSAVKYKAMLYKAYKNVSARLEKKRDNKSVFEFVSEFLSVFCSCLAFPLSLVPGCSYAVTVFVYNHYSCTELARYSKAYQEAIGLLGRKELTIGGYVF